LDDPRPAGGDEAVLGRDEEGVQQDQAADRQKLEEKCHAPSSGAQVLEGSSSTGEARSIGDAPVVPPPLGPARDDEALEVRKRLGDRETALDRRQLVPEEVVRDLVAA